MQQTNGKGRFRCLSPQEIGEFVAETRKQKAMKQITLAQNAGITERTLQRVESGKKTNDDTLRKIARALSLPENALVEPLYVPSAEEIQSGISGFYSEYRPVEAREFATLRDCDAAMGVHAYVMDDRQTPTELAREIAVFMDSFRDSTDMYKHLSHTERLEANESMLEQSRSIRQLGYRIDYGVYTSEDGYRITCFSVASQSGRNSGTNRVFWVPRRMANSLERAC